MKVVAWVAPFAAIFILGLIIAWAYHRPYAAAEAALKNSTCLKDPSSVQVRELHKDDALGTIDGQYNAKNSYGAYVGFKDFSYSIETGNVYGVCDAGL